MSRPDRWRGTAELIGTLAVVLSLLFVGLEVRQNTAAVQTSTSQALYAQHADIVTTYLENPELADVIVQANTDLEGLTLAAGLQYRGYLNLVLNVSEAAYTSLLQGTLDPGLAYGWLVSLGRFKCRPYGERYWRNNSDGYAPPFRAAMDSAMAETVCPS